MKFYLLFMPLLLPSAPALADSCPLFQTAPVGPLHNGHLTPFWAQEYVGADLVRESLANAELARGRAFDAIDVAIIDRGFQLDSIPGLSEDFLASPIYSRVQAIEKGSTGDHATNVANLIAGPAPVGVGARAKIDTLLQMDDFFGDRLAMDRIKQRRPIFTNLSVGFGSFSPLIPLTSGLEDYTIPIHAIGNEFPDPIDEGGVNFGSSPSVHNPNHIYIGNANIYGWFDDRSRESQMVAISAPADDYMTAMSRKGFSNFGGTSGATPMTLASLANTALFLKDLNREEVKILLKNTAIPSLQSLQHPNLNGIGLLNSLKLFEVSRRLAALGWDSASAQERLDLLNMPSTYDFSSICQSERSLSPPVDIKELFSKGAASLKDAGCGSQEIGLNYLRRAFLLSAGTAGQVATDIFRDSAILLASKYREHGFIDNAGFFDSFDEFKLKALIEENKQSTDYKMRIESLRAAAIFGEWARPFIEAAAKDGNEKVRLAAVAGARVLGSHAIDILDTVYSQSEENQQKRLILHYALRLGEAGLRFVNQAFLSTDLDSVVAVLRISREVPNGIRMIKIAAKHSDPGVRAAAISQAGYYGAEGLSLIESASGDSNPGIRCSAMTSAGNLATPDRIRLLRGGIRDSNANVRQCVIRAARSIEEPSGLEILDLGLQDNEGSNRNDALDMLVFWWAQGRSFKGLSPGSLAVIGRMSADPFERRKDILLDVLAHL